MTSLNFKSIGHKVGTFIYLTDEKQLFGIKKAGKKATTYRCVRRSCKYGIKVSINGKKCTRVKENISHNHADNAEIQYLDLIARSEAVKQREVNYHKEQNNVVKNTNSVINTEIDIIIVEESENEVEISSKNIPGPSHKLAETSNNDKENQKPKHNIVKNPRIKIINNTLIKKGSNEISSDHTKQVQVELKKVTVENLFEEIGPTFDYIVENLPMDRTALFPPGLATFRYQPLVKLGKIDICNGCGGSSIDIFFLPCKHKFCVNCANKHKVDFETYLIEDLGLTEKEARTISAACSKCGSHIVKTCKVFTST